MKIWRASKDVVGGHQTFVGISPAKKATLQAFENTCALPLADDYRKFLLENNGGFPSPSCVTFASDAGRKTTSDLFCYFAVGDLPAWISLEWHWQTFSGRLPKDTVPIARDSCGNLWLLKIGGENHDSVYFWDHGTYDTFDETDLGHSPRIAKNFREFQGKLMASPSVAEDPAMPSRYALVNQAIETIRKQNPGFDPRANPDYVWHCDCDDDGEVTIQFVQYVVHAACTHTDGYSRVRAMKGLIKEGPTRMPR
ncbi:MAG: SMI1/KNR4 family protein [Gemmataceae bacterium]